MTRLTWAHAAPSSWPSFADVPASGRAHAPWVRAPLLPRIMPVLRAAALAAVVGVVGGAATAYLLSLVDSSVWHSFTAWAAITSGVGFALRGGWQVAAMAGLVTPLGLVLGFSLSQLAFTDVALAGGSVATYAVLALAAGPFCGAAPRFLRDRCVVTRTAGLAIVSAPWVADGLRLIASALDHDPLIATRLVTGTALLAMGIVLPLLINGSPRDCLRVMATGVGVLAFIVVAGVLPPSGGWADAPIDLHAPGAGLPAVGR